MDSEILNLGPVRHRYVVINAIHCRCFTEHKSFTAKDIQGRAVELSIAYLPEEAQTNKCLHDYRNDLDRDDWNLDILENHYRTKD